MTRLRRAVVFAGGLGSRLGPNHGRGPKAVLPVTHTENLSDIVLDQLRAAGIEHVTFAVGHLAEQVMRVVDGHPHAGMLVDYHVEMEPLGTAGALARIEGLTAPFIVANCDVVTDLRIGDLVATHECEGYALTIAACRRSYRSEFGLLVADEPHARASRVRSIDEKPYVSRLLNMGIYVADPSIRAVIEPGVRTDMDQVIQRLVDIDQPVGLHAHDGSWMDIATDELLAELVEITERRHGSERT